MSDLHELRGRAERLLAQHLGPSWSFSYDTAKLRAGKCDYTRRQISLSRYLAARHSDAENEQTLLHEIAHALAGPAAGHGDAWLRIARQLGYTGGRTHDGEVAREYARWVGICPAGHEIVRFRRPTKPVSCGKCSRRFDRRNLVRWRERTEAERAADRPAS